MSAVLAEAAQNPAAKWELRPLAEVADILDSQRVPVNAKERETRQGTVPYYGATGQVGWIDEHIFDEELVLLGEDGAPFLDSNKAKAYMIRGKTWVNNHAHVLRARTVSTKWLAYYLNSISYADLVAGTTRLKLTQAAMRQIRVPIAPWHVMETVVAEVEKQFSRLDEAVANLKRVKANLKRYKAAVLKAAVEGRLVPTEAELACREGRSYETGAQLLQRILETRRSQWKGNGKYKEPAAPDVTDLPDLPEGWVWASLDDIACDAGYGTSQKCSYENTGPAVLRIPNVQNGSLDLRDLKFAPSGFEVAPPDAIKVGDMLVIRTNGSKSLIGRAAVVLANPPRAISFASYLIRFRLVAMDKLSSWVSVVWQTGCMRSWIESRAATSAGQHNISMSVLATATVPIPPLAEQHRIVAEVDRRLSILGEVQAEVETNLTHGERLRHAVLSAAFIGSATVEEHDR